MGGVRQCIVVLTKPAKPGRVKTRLIGGDLTAERAARLHAAFLHDVAAELAGVHADLRIAWALEPGEEPAIELLPTGIDVIHGSQRGADLGERIFHALEQTAAAGYDRVAAVGSDYPLLTAATVDRAFDLLVASDVVLGPADDGGYYCIATGSGQLDRRLFENIEWSTERVLAQTLERCRQLGAAVALLDRGADVDTPDDLDELCRQLAEPDSARRCLRTCSVLESWGRLTETVR